MWGPAKSVQNSKWLFDYWFGLPKKRRKYFYGLWLFCIGHRRRLSHSQREGPTENLTKPSRRRAEKDDKTREVFFSIFVFTVFFGGWGK